MRLVTDKDNMEMLELETTLTVIDKVFGEGVIATALLALAVLGYSVSFINSKLLIKKGAEAKIIEKKIISRADNVHKNLTEEAKLHTAEDEIDKFLKGHQK